MFNTEDEECFQMYCFLKKFTNLCIVVNRGTNFAIALGIKASCGLLCSPVMYRLWMRKYNPFLFKKDFAGWIWRNKSPQIVESVWEQALSETSATKGVLWHEGSESVLSTSVKFCGSLALWYHQLVGQKRTIQKERQSIIHHSFLFWFPLPRSTRFWKLRSQRHNWIAAMRSRNHETTNYYHERFLGTMLKVIQMNRTVVILLCHLMVMQEDKYRSRIVETGKMGNPCSRIAQSFLFYRRASMAAYGVSSIMCLFLLISQNKNSDSGNWF